MKNAWWIRGPIFGIVALGLTYLTVNKGLPSTIGAILAILCGLTVSLLVDPLLGKMGLH
jgi:hypothetical protein